MTGHLLASVAALALARPGPGLAQDAGAGVPAPPVAPPLSGPGAAGSAAAAWSSGFDAGWAWTRSSLWRVRVRTEGLDAALLWTRPWSRQGEWLEAGARAGAGLDVQSGSTSHGNGLPVLTLGLGARGGLYFGPLELQGRAGVVWLRVDRITDSQGSVYSAGRSMQDLQSDLSLAARLTLGPPRGLAAYAEAGTGLSPGSYRVESQIVIGIRLRPSPSAGP